MTVAPLHPLRWVSWAAVSSLPQAEKVSLDVQQSDNRAAIEKHGGEIVHELLVPGHTRFYLQLDEAAADIEAYAQLRDLIARRAFDVLVYRDMSRLGRTAALCMTIVGLCHRADIATYETTNPPQAIRAGASHSDMLVSAIHSVGAQQEIHRLQERHRMGMIGRVQGGDVPSRAVYGYVLRFDEGGKRRMVVEEAAAAVVRQLIDHYLAGHGTPSVAAWLTEQRLPSWSGAPWSTRMVLNILDRIWRYAGYSEINRTTKTGRPYVRARGNWQAIISEATAERVIAERADRDAHIRHKEGHILSGVCVCNVCGATMGAAWTRPANPAWAEFVALRCFNHRPMTNMTEHRAMAALRLTLQTLQDMAPDELVGGEDDELAPFVAKLAAQEGNRERVEAQIQRAHDAYIAGRMDWETYGAALDKLNGQLHAAALERARLTEAMEGQRSRGTRRERVADVLAHGLTMLGSKDVIALNVWLRRHVRVYIEKARVVRVEFL